MRFVKTCCGYCPEHDQQMDVEVTFVEIPILGGNPQIKKTTFSCEYSDECATCGPSGADCPVYNEAVY